MGSLDGLRAVSILAVIWHHTSDGASEHPIARRGFLGVDMFFVISGFLIVTLLLRERDRTGGVSLRLFYARRTLRIFPVYYLVLLGLAVAFAVRDSPRAAIFWDELPNYLTYTSNWIPAVVYPLTWSLATEEQFYLLWPPVEKALRRAAVPLMVLFVVANQCVNFGLLFAAPGTWLASVYPHLPVLQATFTPICLGVLLAHVLHDARGFQASRGILAARLAAPGIALALVLACNLPSSDIRGAHRLVIQLLMAGLVGACVINEENGLKRILTMRWLARLGVVSYGMYLYHIFVISALHRFDLPQAPLFAASVAGTWFVAEVSYRVFERRFLRLKERFRLDPARR